MNARGIEEMLKEPRFCRVHKSWFVAPEKIDYVKRKHIRIGNEHIPVSETYQKHFFELIEKNKLSLSGKLPFLFCQFSYFKGNPVNGYFSGYTERFCILLFIGVTFIHQSN